MTSAFLFDIPEVLYVLPIRLIIRYFFKVCRTFDMHIIRFRPILPEDELHTYHTLLLLNNYQTKS